MKLGKDRQFKVRLMAPFNMRCTNCGNYIYKATKFNAMKETVQDEDYLGLHIFRFYIRCQRCCNEITFKVRKGLGLNELGARRENVLGGGEGGGAFLRLLPTNASSVFFYYYAGWKWQRLLVFNYYYCFPWSFCAICTPL